MKEYVTPSLELLSVTAEDILTVSDPTMEDILWGELE